MSPLDVIAKPTPAALAYRRAQLERDRAALLKRLEAEQLRPLLDDVEPDRRRRFAALWLEPQ